MLTFFRRNFAQIPFIFRKHFIDNNNTERFLFLTRKKSVLFVFILIALTNYGNGQTNKNVNNNVLVDLSTGISSISVPVYTVSHGSISVPVSLDYFATGIQINQLESVVGTGWQLNAGGVITRTLRDLPDDIKADNCNR